MYLLTISKDLKILIKNYKIITNSDLFLYKSEIIGKVELSIEVIYEIIFSKIKNFELFNKKKIVILIIELLKIIFKFKELKIFNQLGYEFYIDKNIFLKYILELNEEKYISKKEINKNNFLYINTKKSNKILRIAENIEIPKNIIKKLKDKNKENKIIEKENEILLKNIYNNYIKNIKNITEILEIIKPIIYLQTIILSNKKSIIPLIIRMILDIIILIIKRKENNFTKQRIYNYEYLNRISKLMIYFLRQPLLSLITKPFIRKILKILKLNKKITEIIMSMLNYYTNLYFIL